MLCYKVINNFISYSIYSDSYIYDFRKSRNLLPYIAVRFPA